MELIKSILASLLAIVIVGFGLTAGFVLSVVMGVMSVLAVLGTLVALVACAIHEAIRSPSS